MTDNNLTSVIAVSAISGIATGFISTDIIFRLGNEDVIRISESGFFYRDTLITSEKEQIQAFRDYLNALHSRCPLMVPTQGGLRLAADFGAVEVHLMEWCDDARSLVPYDSTSGRTAVAYSVMLHCRHGGTECAGDFQFDPTMPGSSEEAMQQADYLAASLGSVILAADPMLSRSFVLTARQIKLIGEVLRHDR